MSLPDFLLGPNAVLNDDSKWRYKSAPDYSAVNASFEAGKTTTWETNPQSIEFLIQNLVKNWEKEASYKLDPKEWRTISQEKYNFSANGAPGVTAEEMSKLGTYNSLIPLGIKDVYDTSSMDFAKAHKLFKGALKTFSWEVIEIIGGPPKVSIKWRHWGTMTGNYRATLSSGRIVTAKANHKVVEIFGITTAEVNDKFQIISLETFWDPDSMFRQMLTDGVETLEAGEKVEALTTSDAPAGCPVAH